MNSVEKIMEVTVVGMCSYEAASLATKRFPPLSVLCWKVPHLTPLFLGILSVHFVGGQKDWQGRHPQVASFLRKLELIP